MKILKIIGIGNLGRNHFTSELPYSQAVKYIQIPFTILMALCLTLCQANNEDNLIDRLDYVAIWSRGKTNGLLDLTDADREKADGRCRTNLTEDAVRPDSQSAPPRVISNPGAFTIKAFIAFSLGDSPHTFYSGSGGGHLIADKALKGPNAWTSGASNDGTIANIYRDFFTAGKSSLLTLNEAGVLPANGAYWLGTSYSTTDSIFKYNMDASCANWRTAGTTAKGQPGLLSKKDNLRFEEVTPAALPDCSIDTIANLCIAFEK